MGTGSLATLQEFNHKHDSFLKRYFCRNYFPNSRVRLAALAASTAFGVRTRILEYIFLGGNNMYNVDCRLEVQVSGMFWVQRSPVIRESVFTELP